MNADKMMKIIGEANEDYVQSALETRGPKKRHKTISFVSKLVLVAAVMMSMVVTVYASDGLHIETLMTGSWGRHYDSYEKLDKAMDQANLQISAKEEFENGYVFEDMQVLKTRALDADGNERLTYKELDIAYKNAEGHRLSLKASPEREEITGSSAPLAESRLIGDITVEYRESHYKFLPSSKEGNLTEEEKLWQQQPGNYISYGSTTNPAGFQAHERKITSMIWVKDDIRYILMDIEGKATADTLFSMAEELING